MEATDHPEAGRLVPPGRGRRLVLSVAAGVLLICGVGAVGLPVVLFFESTSEAGRGASAPDAAADVYLGQLSAGDELGLRSVLAEGDRDELLEQWRAYRAEMQRVDPPPSKLDYGALDVQAVGGRATVTVPVAATWWGEQRYRSEAYQWRFETVDDGGWRVASVTPPLWCGGYVLESACR